MSELSLTLVDHHPRMAGEGLNMDDILYKAARVKGAPIPFGINLNSRTLGDRNNVLHVAAQYGNHEFITRALAQLNDERYYLHLCQQNFNRETPLHLAAQFGYPNIVKVLLDAHFRAGHESSTLRKECWMVKDNQGDTPLHKALKYGYQETTMSFFNNTHLSSSSTNSLPLADHNNDGESVAYLAAENFRVNCLLKILENNNSNDASLSGYNGQTVFHSARKLPVDTMSKLIELIGRPLLRKQDGFGKTVLHYAVEENRLLMVEKLLGVDSSLACLGDSDGLTPLHVAFKKGIFPMVNIILKMSPQSVEMRDRHGRSALHHAKMDAAFLGKCGTTIDTSKLRFLINRADADGNTPLHLALIKSEEDAAFKLSLFHGCKWRLKNKEGHKPFDLCKSNDKISCTSPVYLKLSDDDSGLWMVRRGSWILTSIESKPFWLSFFGLLSGINLEGMEEEELEKLLSKIGIAAALLIPLNFAAAFNVPGGYNKETGQPVLKKKDASTFMIYSISNIVAFFATMTVLICITFGIRKRLSKKRLAQFGIRLLQLALLATMAAYMSGLYMIGVFGHDEIIGAIIGLLAIYIVLFLVFVLKWFD